MTRLAAILILIIGCNVTLLRAQSNFPVSNLSAAPLYPCTNAVTLAWTQSSAPNIVSNNIYVFANASDATNGVAPVQLFSFPACTSAVVNIVQNSPAQMFIAATAVNDVSVESPFSNLALWPPNPPVLVANHFHLVLQSSGTVSGGFNDLTNLDVDEPATQPMQFYRTKLVMTPEYTN